MNNRILGTIVMVCAPAMLVEALIPSGNTMAVLVGMCSMIFMVGSFCSLVGLWRVAATGYSWWGRAVLAIELVLVSMAAVFGFFEATALLDEQNILFVATDIAWPLSMIWMLAVGITTAVVNRLSSWRRFAPLLCGLTFPASIGISLVGGFDFQSQAIGLIFFGMLAVFWALLGFAVRQTVPAAPLTVAQAHGFV